MALKKLKKLYSTSSKTNSKTGSSTSISDQVSNLKTRLEASGVSTDSRTGLQKALNLREGSGFLEGLGDVLERASGLASIKAIIANDNENLSDAEKAWKALKGDIRYTGVDVAKKFNPSIAEAGTIDKFLAGMAADILLDPATYLSLGAGALAKGATSTGIKALGQVDNLADVTKIMKATKTADQASDVIKGTKYIKGINKATRADDLLKASKLYRTADTLDTIANPLKLVPMGIKKAGGLATKGLDKINPEITKSLGRLGDEFKKTFNFSKHLKDNIGEAAYKKMKNAESVAEATMSAVSSKTGEQYKLVQKALKGIKQDPDRVWTIVSKVDGSKSTFSFAGLTDEEITKKLYEFIHNEVYFNRPTVVDADTVNDLVRNNGRSMIAAQDFANPKDRRNFETSLKAIAKDPDQVSVSRYYPKDTPRSNNFFDFTKSNGNEEFMNDDVITKNSDGWVKSAKEYAKSKGYEVAEVVYMTPDEYIRYLGKMWKKSRKKVYEGIENVDNIANYADDMVKGDKFPVPYIDYKLSTQEGRTRALAAKQAGANKIPVLILSDSADKVQDVLSKSEIIANPTALARQAADEVSGWVVDIGAENANYMMKKIEKINKNFDTQTARYSKQKVRHEKVLQGRKELEQAIINNTAQQEELTRQINLAEELGEKSAQLKDRMKELNTAAKVKPSIKQTKKFQTEYANLRMEMGKLNKEVKKVDVDALKKELLKAKRTNNLLKANLVRKDNTTIANSTALLEQIAKDVETSKIQKNLAEDAFSTRQLVPYASPKIDMPEIQEAAKLQKEITDVNLGLRNISGTNIGGMDKYDYYIHRKILPENKDYIVSHNIKNNPTRSFLMGETNKLPAQAALTNLYGNYSAVEANTMMGFDLFDVNPVADNLDMVTKLNRRTYNSNLTKTLFTEPNNWVKDVSKLTNADKGELLKQGFEPVTSTEIASKLKLNEILNEEDINKITEQLKGKTFLMHRDVADMFDKNIKLYKQLDSEFYQQLNKYMKYWKGGNLLSVGYHLRNIFGAQTNMALSGMSLSDVAKYTSQAGLDIARYNNKLLPEFSKWIQIPSNADIFKRGTLDDVAKAFAAQVGEKDAKLFTEMLDAQLKGAWGGIVGQHDAVKRAIGEMPTTKLGRVADKVHDVNYKLGATSDDINRLASYRWAQNPNNAAKVAKVGAADALDFVNYAMFDFKSMSPAEQAYFTKMFPFYNFIKNNLVFQFKNMAANGQRYNTLSKAYKNLYSAQEITDDEIQQYVKDQLYIPIKQANGNIKVLKIAAPVQDATNLLSLKNILGASNPIIQYITDRAYGEDLYTGAELTNDRTKNTQEFVDILPYGRTARTLLSNPLSVLLPISSTTSEKGRNQNAYDELERLERLRNQYKKKTGQSLPTLEDLGLR